MISLLVAGPFARRTVRMTALAFVVGFSNGVSAQDSNLDRDADTVEEIVVTGSRIPRSSFESLQPAMVLDRQALDDRGSLDIAKNLNEQAAFELSTDPGGTQGTTVGRNMVNLFGLGTRRTLTLVNGHRMPANNGFSLAVDLNAIPEALVQRVETIAIGGAPIYGSDAIAGTVNIILRDDFEGLELSGSLGGSPEFSDAGETRLTGTWGKNFGNGRGNIAISGQFFTIDGLKETDRPATETLSGFETPGDPNSPYELQLFDDLVVAVDNQRPFPQFFGDLFFFNVFGNAIPLDINDPASPFSQFDADGNMIPFVPGGETGSTIFPNGGDGLRLAPVTALYTDYDRYNANLFLNYDLTDTITAKAELWFARTEATQVVRQQYFNSSAFGGIPFNNYGNVGEGPIPVLIDNPFLTDATRTSITAALDVVHDFNGDGVADPTIDTDGDGVPDAVGFWRSGPLNVGSSNANSTTQDTYRVVLGLDGELDIGSKGFHWDAAYTYGRVEIENSELAMHQPRFEQSVQVVTDAGGNPACVDPANGCVPLNVVGTPSQAAIDFVTEWTVDKPTLEQHVFTANSAGELLHMPAGPLGAAVGFAYRDERARYEPNALSEAGDSRFPAADPFDEGFSSTEFYVEAVVPLLGGDLNTPLVETLEFEGAIRFVDNSVAGTDTTWTAGLRYRPIPDIEFRGNVTESIRAPSLGELFLPETVVTAFANDPCDERFIGQGNVPDTRATNCADDGIVQPFQSFIVNASQTGISSGNSNLSSEVAESFTYGVILRPRFWENFIISIDWLDIEIGNAIESLSLVDLMTACYDSSNFASESACDLFTRGPGGQIIDFRSGYVNVAVVEFAGLQTVIDYSIEMGRFGDLRLTANYVYTERRRETPGSGNTQRLEGEIGRSQHRVTLGASWHVNKWTWFNQFRWLSSAVFDNADQEFTRDVRGVDDWLVVDTSLNFRPNDNWDFQLIVDNLFDTGSPYAAVASGNGIQAYYPGVAGRYVRVQGRYRF